MEKYIKEININNIKFTNILLAPMAGITDMPFRCICNKYGNVEYTPTEMVSTKGLVYKDKKTHKIMDAYIGESPRVVQLFGSETDVIKRVLEKLNEDETIDIIDFNMGCPAPKVVKNGDGSALLKDLNKVEEIIRTLTTYSKKPVCIKTRLGINREKLTAIHVAKLCEKYGVAMLVVHGRTKEELYRGKADLDEIKKVKESVSIPVIGNGDVIDIKSAKEMFEQTGVDGIMIGRAAIGNPWIFRSIKEGREYLPSNKERYDVIIEHLKLALKYDREEVAIPKMRKHIAYYLKGLKNSSYAKELINKEMTFKGVEDILTKYFETLE